MTSLTELKRSIFGAWLLVRFDPNGLLFFGNSIGAFWRSYWAAIFAAPAYIALVIIQTPNLMVTVGPLRATIIQISSYITAWFAMPFVMLYICRIVDREKQFYRYFIAYNWATLLQVTLILIVTILTKSGVFPSVFSGILTFVAIIAVLVYQGFIARVALVISSAGAFAVVTLDLMISLLVETWTAKLLLGHRLLGG